MPSGEQCLLVATRDWCWPLIKGAAAAEVVIVSVASGLKGSRRTTRPCSRCERQGVPWMQFDASDKKNTSDLLIVLPNLGNNIF